MTANSEAAAKDRAREVTTALRQLPIIARILERLAKELSPKLFYHSLQHTNEVLDEVVLLATYDGLPARETELLAIAAAFHDSGFLTRNEDNEALGANLAVDELRREGTYSLKDMSIVERAILDTKLVGTLYGFHQIPTTPLAGYLLDADLGNLGRSDFFEKSELMYRELNAPKELFLINTLELMYGHRWNSPAALTLREKRKQENVAELRKVLKASVVPTQQGPLHRLSREQLEFISGLPIVLNTAGDLKDKIAQILRELDAYLNAEASTVFLLTPDKQELEFWVLDNERSARLTGMKMPVGAGIVGHVLERQESVLVPDCSSDPRFFRDIDKKTGFITRDLICAPLTARGKRKLGAIEVMNKKNGSLSLSDLVLVDLVAHAASLVLENLMDTSPR